MIVATVGMTLALASSTIVMVNNESTLAIMFLSLFVFSFNLGPGPAMWIIISEIYPISLRSQALSLGSVCLWLSSFFAGMIFPTVERYLEEWSFAPFTIVCYIFVIFVYKVVPETRNKSLLSIQEELVL